MEIKYYGGNCIKISSKKSSIVVDDVTSLTGKSIVTDKDIAVITDTRIVTTSNKAHFIVDGPGEYEIADVSIRGIAARSHIDPEKTTNTTMYRIIIDDVRIALVGHIYPDIDENQLEEFGTIDILCIPVGGNGYTLDGIGAHKIIQKIEPKVIIPTHYSDKNLNYEVPQSDLDSVLKALAIEPSETLETLKIKNSEFGEGTRLVVLERK